MAERENIKTYGNKACRNITGAGMIDFSNQDEQALVDKAMATWPKWYKKIGGAELPSKVMNKHEREMPK